MITLQGSLAEEGAIDLLIYLMDMNPSAAIDVWIDKSLPPWEFRYSYSSSPLNNTLALGTSAGVSWKNYIQRKTAPDVPFEG